MHVFEINIQGQGVIRNLTLRAKCTTHQAAEILAEGIVEYLKPIDERVYVNTIYMVEE